VGFEEMCPLNKYIRVGGNEETLLDLRVGQCEVQHDRAGMVGQGRGKHSSRSGEKIIRPLAAV